MSDVVDDQELDDIEPVLEDPSFDWSPFVYRAARSAQGLILLAALVAVGFGFARVGPLAVIGRATHRGLDELEVIGAPPPATTPPTTTTTTLPTTTTPVPTTVPAPVFDPLNGLYGSFPGAAKPDIGEGATGQEVLYLEAVLVQRGGQALAAVDDLFGPDTTTAVLNLQAFFSLPQTGVVDAATWQAVDFLASQPAT